VVGVQEEGAQLIAWALGAAPGETVLDACAGRGGKTLLLSERMAQRGQLWAADKFPDKLAQLRAAFERQGYPVPTLSAVDWERGTGDVPEGFDRILVDAPCTGTGTLRRRPEIMLRLSRDDVSRLAQVQEAIVRSAATRLKPGGYLLYAVCSVLPEEGPQVVERLADVLGPTVFSADLPGGLASPGSSTLALDPERHATDGYFLACLQPR
jgi:16S rRNA (cytosine967-C5)-methyltransferase